MARGSVVGSLFDLALALSCPAMTDMLRYTIKWAEACISLIR
jgi:hypothetical protein